MFVEGNIPVNIDFSNFSRKLRDEGVHLEKVVQNDKHSTVHSLNTKHVDTPQLNESKNEPSRESIHGFFGQVQLDYP